MMTPRNGPEDSIGQTRSVLVWISQGSGRVPAQMVFGSAWQESGSQSQGQGARPAGVRPRSQIVTGVKETFWGRVKRAELRAPLGGGGCKYKEKLRQQSIERAGFGEEPVEDWGPCLLVGWGCMQQGGLRMNKEWHQSNTPHGKKPRPPLLARFHDPLQELLLKKKMSQFSPC